MKKGAYSKGYTNRFMGKEEFVKEITNIEEDFAKAVTDYLMFSKGIDVREFNEALTSKIVYSSKIMPSETSISILIDREGDLNE